MPTLWQPPDLDEVRPNRFVINNDKLRPILRGEGVTAGKFFELVTWRREGLVARLRMHGFNVRTLDDRVAALPALPNVAPPGEVGVRELTHPKERIALFDRQHLRWIDLPVVEHHGRAAVRIPVGTALRRRKGRGHADYYLAAVGQNNQVNFLPVNETDALLHAYAQIALAGPPAFIRYANKDDAFFVAQRQALLPPPHHELLLTLQQDNSERWTVAAPHFEMAEQVFAKLGVRLQAGS
jgi:hypothetical protein